MGRFFPYADPEQIIRNFRHPKGDSYNATFLYPRQGCMRIVHSVASHLDISRISLRERLLCVDLHNHNALTDRRIIHYDNLISTIPFPKLLSMCGIQYDPDIYSWNKVLVFNLGFDAKGPERRNSWMYFPESKYCFYRVGFYDNIIGQDRMSLYVEIGFAKDQPVGNLDDLLHRTLLDLRAAGILDGQHLVASHHVIMDPAYVHITRRSEADKQIKMKQLAQHNVHSIGRYGAWKYCSLEDNIFDAFTLASSQ